MPATLGRLAVGTARSAISQIGGMYRTNVLVNCPRAHMINNVVGLEFSPSLLSCNYAAAAEATEAAPAAKKATKPAKSNAAKSTRTKSVKADQKQDDESKDDGSDNGSRTQGRTRTRTRKSSATNSTDGQESTPKHALRSQVKKKRKRREPAKSKGTGARRKKRSTPERKALVARKKGLELIKELRTKALRPPALKLTSAYAAYLSIHSSADFKKSAAEWRGLPFSESKLYESIAEDNRRANTEAYRKWILSHSPEQIRQANVARRMLRTRMQKLYPDCKTFTSRALYAPLTDNRQPKKVLSAYILFNTARLKGAPDRIPAKEALKISAKEWRELAHSDKKMYQELSEADRLRHANEFQAAYGYEYTPVKSSSTASPPASPP